MILNTPSDTQAGVHTHTHTHTHECKHTHTHMRTCVRTDTHTELKAYICSTHTHTHTQADTQPLLMCTTELAEPPTQDQYTVNCGEKTPINPPLT